MIISVGTDIIEISRVQRAIETRGDRFLNRIFTEQEIAYCEGRASRFASYAARLAAKEAAMKALGTGWGKGVQWRDVEMLREGEGAPCLRLFGTARQIFEDNGARTAHLSVSHSEDLAIAFVIFEG